SAPTLGGSAEEGAAPLVFAEDGVYRSDGGARVFAGRVLSAYAKKDGYVALVTDSLDAEGDGFQLLQQAAPGAEPSHVEMGAELMTQKLDQILPRAVVFGLLVGPVVPQKREEKDRPKDAPAEEEGLPRLLYQPLPAERPAASFVDAGVLDWLQAPL